MRPQLRSLLLAIGCLIYVGLAALPGAPQPVLVWAALFLLPLALWRAWRKSLAPREGVDPIEPSQRSALRIATWGAALWLMARLGPIGSGGLDAAANVGAGAVVICALVALARIPPAGGLLMPPPSTRSFDAAALTGILWGIAVALPAARVIWPGRYLALDPLAIDYATTTAAVASLLVLIAASWRARALRKLEVGVADRAAGALALSLTGALVAVPATLLDVAAPDRLVPVSAMVASFGCLWTVTARDPARVSGALRAIVALMLLGTPLGLLAAVLTRQVPEHGGAIVLVACGVSIAIGLAARTVAKPLGPEQSRWLDAIDDACRGALTPDPDAAIRAALMALSKTAPSPKARPELWRLDPEEALSVDLAGYSHTDPSKTPSRLIDLALLEPERSLRIDVLEALQVRRPDVRPLVAWFQSRHAFSATLVLDEDGPAGFLLLPRGNRRSPLSLEEARAIRVLADRIASLLAISSALARSRRRELDSRAAQAKLEGERDHLESALEGETEAHRNFARLVAHSAMVAHYSPAARSLDEKLRELSREAGPVWLVAPPGVSPLAWAARLHLADESRGRFVIVDSTESALQELERWTEDPRSPLIVAEAGSLVVRDAQALPREIQEALADRPARDGAPSLILTSNADVETLVAGGRLCSSLAERVQDRQLRVEPLCERAEDIHPLLLDTLAREGLRRRGRPLGLEPRALGLLIEHSWPGNENELADLCRKLGGVAEGETVTVADLASADFRPVNTTGIPALATPLPSAAEGRSRRRPPRLRRR